jgi:hypothetical protein
MVEQIPEFDFEKFKSDFRKEISDLHYKRYSSSQELDEIKSKLIIYYKKHEVVQNYFKSRQIRHYFMSGFTPDRGFATGLVGSRKGV